MIFRGAAAFFAVLSCAFAAHAATPTVCQFPVAGPLVDADIAVVEQNGHLPAKQVSLALVKGYLLGSPINASGTNASGPGPSERPDQMGLAATLSDSDILVLDQCSSPPTRKIALSALKSYLAVPLTLFVGGAALLVDPCTSKFVASH